MAETQGSRIKLVWVAKLNVSPEVLHVVMEGTGVYHEQAALALAEAGVTVSIVNPAQVKDFGRGLAVRTKTDGVDSFVLARYGALLKPKAWVPPAPEARILQALPARRVAIAQDLQRERNRQEKADATDTPERICIVATRCNPHVKAVYERLLARGKSKMSALGAAMRKLVHLCFGVLKTQQPYEHDYSKNA